MAPSCAAAGLAQHLGPLEAATIQLQRDSPARAIARLATVPAEKFACDPIGSPAGIAPTTNHRRSVWCDRPRFSPWVGIQVGAYALANAAKRF